jgi:hypothetical protein
MDEFVPMDPAREVLQLTQDVVTLATESQIAAGDVASNSYIVMFRTRKQPLSLQSGSYLSEYQFHYSWLQASYLADPGIEDIDYITTIDMSDPQDPQFTADFLIPRSLKLAWNGTPDVPVLGSMATVTFKTAEEAATILNQWALDRRIWYAEPNYYNQRMDLFGDAKAAYEAAADAGTEFWWHKIIKLHEAFESLSRRDLEKHPADDAIVPPVIAVLDSGIDVTNPYLEGRIWVNTSPGSSGCDGDVNGCNTTSGSKGNLGSGNLTPFGFANGACGAQPILGTCIHGTHVSGIIAAKLDANAQIGGVCPVCKVMGIKIISGNGKAADSAILRGMKYITLFKQKNSAAVRVINSSFGKYNRSRSVAVLVGVLKKSPHEVLVVGAAGNEDSMARVYPAALGDAIAVSAFGEGLRKSAYSNFGPWVDIAAPGGDEKVDGSMIMSTVPGAGQTDRSQGTSMAAPVVSGVAGLILAIDPNRSHTRLRSSIVRRADGKTLYSKSTAGGYNFNFYFPKVAGEDTPRPLLGTGILDAVAAIEDSGGTPKEYGAIDRVTKGCSVVGLKDKGPLSIWMLLLFTPLLFVRWRA